MSQQSGASTGKSTVVAMLGQREAVYRGGIKVILVSRSLRQSTELLRIVTDFHERVRLPLLDHKNAGELRLTNHSRIICLPCKEETIRGFSRINILIIDEAARVPDDLYRAVRPMLAVSQGRMICLSTPYGKRGFFYDAWANGGNDWGRIEVPAQQISRITPEFLAGERRGLGVSWFRQEYECSFETLGGLAYPDFIKYVTVDALPAQLLGVGHKVGGIDFGFRNPFAAIWGTVDRDDVLWLTGEHYERYHPLSHHATKLPRPVRWYADPSGAGEISELKRAGFAISAGDNALRQGIAAVTARLQTGRLKVAPGACPNLLAEAQLYRYSDDNTDKRGETPVDDNNHALAALRYLVSKLDAGRTARAGPAEKPEDKARKREERERQKQREWLSVRNEALWTRFI